MQPFLISKTEIEKLKAHLPNIETILCNGNIDEIQIAIMTAIDKTLDKDNEATAETLELEKIYDKISEQYKQMLYQMDTKTSAKKK